MLDGDLFGYRPDTRVQLAPVVPGLRYVPDFVSADEAERIVSAIDSDDWNEDLLRRVQHYGHRYDYKARSIGGDGRAAPLPPWATGLANRLAKRQLFDVVPDQMIINEYMPGQGIASHIDCVPCFGDTIASISFLSPCIMVFKRRADGAIIEIDLAPGSAILLSGEARYSWTHGIAARANDRVSGTIRPRRRRLSATFRSVLT